MGWCLKCGGELTPFCVKCSSEWNEEILKNINEASRKAIQNDLDGLNIGSKKPSGELGEYNPLTKTFSKK